MAIDPSKPKATKSKPQQAKGAEVELKPAPKKENAKFNKIILISFVVVLVVVAVTLMVKTFRDKPEAETAAAVPQASVSPNDQTSADTEEQAPVDPALEGKPWLQDSQGITPQEETKPDASVVGEDVGIQDATGDTVKVNNTPVSNNTFVKDLKGNSIGQNYDVSNISVVVDFISYKKRRAVTGKGVEIYWLDAMYKGSPARVQVPLSIFKELDAEGITMADVEVVTIPSSDGGPAHQIATYFNVRPDYKKLLDNQ